MFVGQVSGNLKHFRKLNYQGRKYMRLTKRKSCYTDFEFNRIVHPQVNLVSGAIFDPTTKYKKNYWLHNDKKAQARAKADYERFDLIIAFSAIAECRSFLALGLDPLKFDWIDLFLEYRCLTNHNDNLQWGKQLVNGKVKNTRKPRPKWQREEGEEAAGFRATHSLAEATYKLTGQIRDTEHKDKMRELIISDPEFFSVKQREEIMKYGMQDVVFLPLMWKRIKEEYFKLDPSLTEEQLIKDAILRGRFAAHTSIMEAKGYPINVEKTKNFSSQVGNILFDIQREINELFPKIKPFKWDRRDNRFTWNQKITREWIENETPHAKDWMKTDTGALSLSLEAFERYFDFKHNYPKNNFGAQIVRFLKLKQSIYGFVPSAKEGKKTFWDSVGPDGRVRPYTNIYGSQASRSQPSSTGFMFLKPAWMRALVEPAPGMAMGGIDYGSEEYYIQALLSGDQNMIKAYLSGDVYLAFAKDAGIVPSTATKESHKKERDTAKATVLAISYLMSKYGLAIKLTQDSGEEWDEDMSQEMIDLFYEAYPLLKEFQDWIVQDYQDNGFLRLPCGWYVFGDNENHRSVTNAPSQGFGASVLRKAVDLAVARGLYVCFTLHDALYIEFKKGEEYKMEILRDCMREAFQFYFPKEDKELAGKIKLDPFIWGPDYKPDSEIKLKSGYVVPCSNLYIDSRSQVDYDAFSKYFKPTKASLL